MVYGLIFLDHAKTNADVQRQEIQHFVAKHGIIIDEFVSYCDNPDITMFKTNDTLICYAWNCICSGWDFLRIFIKYVLNNKINLLPITSKYHIDSTTDFNQLRYAFDMCEDIRFNFLSHKSVIGAKKRIENGHAPGRPTGSINTKHILDGKEKVVWDMYNNGFSMYAISKKLKVSAPTIKRFLTAQS